MKRNEIKVLVITGFGLNCEKETAAACRLVGAQAELVHLTDLLNGTKTLDEYQMLTFIGGFSFGDHLGSGTVFANRVKFNLKDQLEKFIADGKLIIGICNGFQTLTRLGLVPALNGNYFEQECAFSKPNPQAPASLPKALTKSVCLCVTAKANLLQLRKSSPKSKQKISSLFAMSMLTVNLQLNFPPIPTAHSIQLPVSVTKPAVFSA